MVYPAWYSLSGVARLSVRNAFICGVHLWSSSVGTDVEILVAVGAASGSADRVLLGGFMYLCFAHRWVLVHGSGREEEENITG